MQDKLVAIEAQWHEAMREHSTTLRRLIEMLTLPVMYPIPRGALAASEQSIPKSNGGLVLYGTIATKVGGAAQIKVCIGSGASDRACDNINIAAGDPQVGVFRNYGPMGIDIEDGVFTSVVAGTMDVIYLVGRRAVAVNKSV